MSLDVGFLPTAFVDNVTKNYVNFNGRTSRMGFWHWFLAYFVLAVVISLVASKLGSAGALISNIFAVAMILPAYAIGARRLHDVGKSGWWQLLVLTIIGIIVLIIWWAKAGDAGSNAFGDVPAAKAV